MVNIQLITSKWRFTCYLYGKWQVPINGILNNIDFKAILMPPLNLGYPLSIFLDFISLALLAQEILICLYINNPCVALIRFCH